MWFLTIESFALLAVAAIVGVFSGWLIWGGQPTGSAEAFAKARLTPQTHLLAQTDLLRQTQSAEGPAAEAVQENTQSEPAQDSLQSKDLLIQSPVEQEIASKPEDLQLIIDLRYELDRTAERLQTREDDVARLKSKLRKAVEEIEKRTAIAQHARAELIDHERLLAANSAATDPNSGSQAALNAEEIDELIRARTASLLIQTSQLERRAALTQRRAEEAEDALAALQLELSNQQSAAIVLLNDHETQKQAAMAKAEQEAADRVLALEIDLAGARQRATVATTELMSFGSEIAAIRETNSNHLRAVHETMRELQLRLDTTKAALSGRPLTTSDPG